MCVLGGGRGDVVCHGFRERCQPTTTTKTGPVLVVDYSEVSKVYIKSTLQLAVMNLVLHYTGQEDIKGVKHSTGQCQPCTCHADGFNHTKCFHKLSLWAPRGEVILPGLSKPHAHCSGTLNSGDTCWPQVSTAFRH